MYLVQWQNSAKYWTLNREIVHRSMLVTMYLVKGTKDTDWCETGYCQLKVKVIPRSLLYLFCNLTICWLYVFAMLLENKSYTSLHLACFVSVIKFHLMPNKWILLQTRQAPPYPWIGIGHVLHTPNYDVAAYMTSYLISFSSPPTQPCI